MTHLGGPGGRLAVAAAILAVVAVASIRGGGAPAAQAAATPWDADYFDNPTLSGTPVIERDDAAIDFAWLQASPDPAVPADEFSVRWTNTLTLAAGAWRFSTYTDDGVRLYVDDVLVIDQWVVQPPTQWQADVPVEAGEHEVVMEYYEDTGDAYAYLSFGPVVDPAINGWRGEYFANPTLAGEPVVVRDDTAIDFDWQFGAPVASDFMSEHFSVRWTGTMDVPAGRYRIAATVDDGVRVWVDGTLVIDSWLVQFVTPHFGHVDLTAGEHDVVMEYFEQFGLASARLTWAADSDGDGCTDVQEQSPNPALGGDRNPLDFWDFYDVTNDVVIDLSDTLLILQHFAHGHDDDPLDALLDRYAPDPLKPYRTAPAPPLLQGIDLSEALLSLRSFAHSCV